MSILNYYKGSVYQSGTTGYPIFVITDDVIATITSAGWLNQAVNQGLIVNPNDFIFVSYQGINQAQFTPSIDSHGIITLTASDSADFITPPITVNHFAQFTSDSKVKDTGKVPSDGTQSNVVMQKNPSGVGKIATYADTAGTINSSPANVRAGTSAFGGGSTTATITDANITTVHIPFVSIGTSTNPASIIQVTPGNGNIVVKLSADPGAGTVFNYFALLPQ